MTFENPQLIKGFRSHRNRHEWRKAIIYTLIGFALALVASTAVRAEDAIVADVPYEYVETPYQTIGISDSEMAELRWVLALEAQTQGVDGEIACCEVVFNRCLSQKNNWGGSVHGVLSRKKQFSTYHLIGSKKAWAVPGEMEDDAISETLRGTSILQKYLYMEQVAGRIPAYIKASDYVYFDTGAKNGYWNFKIGGHWFGSEVR